MADVGADEVPGSAAVEPGHLHVVPPPMEMVLARICRATGAQEKAAMIQTRFQVLCPRKAR